MDTRRRVSRVGNERGAYLYGPAATTLNSDYLAIFDHLLGHGIPLNTMTIWYPASDEGWHYMDVRPLWSTVGGYQLRWSREDGWRDGDIAGALTWQLPEMTGYNSMLDEVIDTDDVLALPLERGDRLTLSLEHEIYGNFDLLLFGPDTVSVLSGTPVASGVEGGAAETLSYVASTSGTYYLNIRVASGVGEYWVSGSVDFVRMPVYRFYNITNGAHFYTASATERDTVIARWPDIYTYEGVAYRVNTGNADNSAPLYRFYNKVNGSHFYTASAEERNTVISRWPNVYTYEGPVYNVCASPIAGSAPVYRFYNKRIGTHFYTTSVGERDTVIVRWPDVYTYEGPSFWLAAIGVERLIALT